MVWDYVWVFLLFLHVWDENISNRCVLLLRAKIVEVRVSHELRGSAPLDSPIVRSARCSRVTHFWVVVFQKS